MDSALINAIARRDALEQRVSAAKQAIAESERQLAEIARFIDEWHKYADLTAEINTHVNEEAPRVTPTQRAPRARGNPKKEVVAGFVLDLAKREGKPVPRSYVLEEMNRYGLTLAGSDPAKVLSTMLWRMRHEVCLIDNFGYWAREVPYPPAGYIPPKPTPSYFD